MKKIYIKIKKLIKKHDNIFVIMLIFLSIFGITLNTSITNTDELWNFQNIYKMYNGFQIYKDANVIDTPLFFWLGELLFKIFDANFFIFRFYNILIMVTIYLVTYLIFKELKIPKKVSIICILALIVYKNFGMTLIQANYNTMALMFCLIGILINMKKYFRIKIKNLLKEFFIFAVFLTILILYFYINNNLYNLISYTVLGIREFAKENILIEYSSFIAMLSIISINLILTRFFTKSKKVKLNEIEKQNLILFNCFSIPLVLIMFPIFNMAHYLIGIHVSLILFIYLIKIIINRIDLKINPKIISSAALVGCIITITISSVYFYSWNTTINSESYEVDKNSPFYGGIITKELIDNISNIVSYIKNEEENVIVLSSKAALYMVPAKRSNGMMDLPFKGNLGKDGEKGLIKTIENMTNIKILIEKDDSKLIYQESKRVRQYIIDNMQKIGEIEEFDIYWK